MSSKTIEVVSAILNEDDDNLLASNLTHTGIKLASKVTN